MWDIHVALFRPSAVTVCPTAATLRGEDCSGEADQGILDPLLDRTRDAVLRVRLLAHRRTQLPTANHGSPAACAFPAHGGPTMLPVQWVEWPWDRR